MLAKILNLNFWPCPGHIPEAGIKNLQFSFILISTLCASLLTSLLQSTCLIKLNPEFRVIFIRGVTFWLQKIKKKNH